jgi:transcriptional regulator with XRE-family HTH domain
MASILMLLWEVTVTRLRVWRAEQGLTLDEAASRLGMSRNSLHLIENGRLSPSATQRDLLSRVFGDGVDAILRPIRSGVR